MFQPGDVVTVPFQGVTGVKQRPAVVLSSEVYRANRPDMILGLLTTQTGAATTPTDYVLVDWAVAGLHRASAFRAFLLTVPRTDVLAHIGRLSDQDWQAVCARITIALGVTTP